MQQAENAEEFIDVVSNAIVRESQDSFTAKRIWGIEDTVQCRAPDKAGGESEL